MEKISSEERLVVGNEYSKNDLEEIFHRGFGWMIKGISPGKWDDKTPYILIFSRGDGPYSDKIEEDILYYDGEGEGKDQELTRDNRLLKEANTNGRIIYGFRKENKESQWKYLGILQLLDCHYIKEGEFMKYEFRFRIEGLPTLQKKHQEIIDISKISLSDHPELTDERRYSNVQRLARKKAFSDQVKRIYDFQCAICGKRRFSSAQYPEVEAAHIFPKDKNGSDDLRNGIALCKLHHWAFDTGLVSIADDFTLLIEKRIKDDTNYNEISQYEGKKIYLPSERKFYPHPIFLKKHREIQGFETK